MVTESQRFADSSERGIHIGHTESANALNAFNLGSIRHHLTLLVNAPGVAPFEVRGEFKVPAKATGRSGYVLPVGIQVPVVVRDADAGRIDIDWDAFFAGDGWKQAVRHAAVVESHDRAKASTNAVPGLREQTWASAAQGLPNWMHAVRTGAMKRKAFEQQLDGLLRLGQMDPAAAAEARRQLDAEGF